MSKRLLQENEARYIFRKTIISYPLIRTRFVTPVSRFAISPYYRHITKFSKESVKEGQDFLDFLHELIPKSLVRKPLS